MADAQPPNGNGNGKEPRLPLGLIFGALALGGSMWWSLKGDIQREGDTNFNSMLRRTQRNEDDIRALEERARFLEMEVARLSALHEKD